MKPRTYLRHVKEGLKNLTRNGWMTFSAISAVAVTLLLVGAFLLLMINLNAIATEIENEVEVRAYIERTATLDQQKELQQNIKQLPLVASVDYIPRDEGLDQLIDSLGDEGKVFESLRNENPLKDAFAVKAKRPQDTPELAKQIEKLPYIANVEYGEKTVKRIFKTTEIVRNIGLALIVGLVFTAVFLIANTIKLTIVSRRREIEIMKLVGATNGFIRWPFFIEGMFLGLFGAVIPIAILTMAYRSLYNIVNEELKTMFISLVPLADLVWPLVGLLLLIGVFIGIWGSLMSVRKFLRV